MVEAFDYYLDINGAKMTINPFNITPRMGAMLNEKITNARVAAFVSGKIAPEEGESKTDWIKRFNQHIKEENDKYQEEDAYSFIKRSVSTSVHKDNMQFMFDCLKSISEVFGQESKVTQDGFDNASVELMNNFICRICKKAKVPIEFSIDDLTPDF